MASYGKQFTLLLWKNFVLQKRRVCVTVFEVLMPIWFACLFVLIRALADSENITDPTLSSSFSPILNTSSVASLFSRQRKLLYTPKTAPIENLLLTVNSSILQSINKSVEVIGYDSESDLVNKYLSDESVWAGVVFNGNFTTALPQNITYSLRVSLLNQNNDEWQTRSTLPFYGSVGPRNDQDKGGTPNYYRTGFLFLQYLIDKAIIEQESANVTDLEQEVTTLLKKMPYPPYLKDVLTVVMRTSLPIFIIFSFVLNALQTTRNIAQEKERNLKESMKMMGLSTFIYWLSWFIKSLIYLVIALIFYVLLFKIPVGEKGKVLNYTEPTLFFFFLFCYALATIAFCFMVSTWFNKANTAAFAADILFFLTYTPYSFIVNQYETMGRPLKLFSCILSNTAMSMGCAVLTIYEGSGEGAQWNNFHKPGVVDDNFTLLDAILMLLLDTFLYTLIAWYVDNVHPGEYGVAQPFYFPFLPSYWCGESFSSKEEHIQTFERNIDEEHFEQDPKDLKIGISIKRLRKVFGSGKGKKVAVDDMTLNMFEGQITSLLGHNGAGKTTTMSMLTGFLTPTSGTAYVNGYSIRSEIASVRKNLGLCPQHNILFDLLTVEEHLRFFAQLKGCPSKHLQSEIDEMIRVVGLESKRTALSQTLSGGQKRKLSVGIALIADSKIIILDEPTSGMDPAARRQTWEILQRYREGRTIILTTHFMDEADILGDRIAIMAEGVVKCCGTSMFLKKQYGAGYHLVIVKDRDCDVDQVTAFVQKHIPTATLESEISAEISYLLPFDQSTKFEGLFLEFEDKMKKLGVSSFGTSATTMEEVFLKVGESAEKDTESLDDDSTERTELSLSHTNPAYGSLDEGTYRKLNEDRDSPKLIKNGNMTDFSNSVTSVPVEDELAGDRFIAFNRGIKKNFGMTLTLQQFWGMFIKKVIHTWRNRIVTAVQLILPVLFTINALLIEKTIPTPGDEPSLILDLGKFGGSDVAYSSGLNATQMQTNMASRYETLFPRERTQFVSREPGKGFDTMAEFFLSTAKTVGTSTFNKKYIVAGEFQDESPLTNVTAHFNGQPFHSPAISLGYMMTGLLQYFTGSTERSITTINAPFPKRLEESTNNAYFSTATTGFVIALEVLFGMSFMVTTFIIFLIKEKAVGAKHIQVVSGVGPGAFWFSTFLWDIINYTVPVFGIMIVFAAYQTEAYVDNGRLAIVFLIYLLYGWSVLPFVYIFHSLFKTPAAGMVAVSFINIVTGLVFLLAVYTLSIPSLGTEDVSKGLQWIGLILFPNYNLGQALIDMYTNHGYAELCEKAKYEFICATIDAGAKIGMKAEFPCCFPDHCGDTCFTFYKNYLEWNAPGIGRYLVFMALQGILYFALVIGMEYGIFRRIMYAIRGDKSEVVGVPRVVGGQVLSVASTMVEDSDVADERRRLDQTPIEAVMQTDSLIIKNVSKYYGSYCAVNNVSVGVPPDECFGLLGQNGAGKTTIFKMVTGDVDLTSGNAYLSAYSIKDDIKQVQRNLGYCPQFDALIDQMTGRETLTMYARLRGIQEGRIKSVVRELLDIMMLTKYADKKAGHYSGGNKRKLSTAIALIGDPPFIFLDEPTTGMDPRARRQLWNVLSQVRASGRTLVLTSHSMEECDALCTKIVIMVNGKFVCHGSPQHLKNKFGHGYTLMCRMGINNDGYVAPVEPLIQFVKSVFPSSHVFDDQQGYVHFQIPDTSTKLAQIFGKMEEAKQKFQMDDYSVHQTTLEQIFITFTRNQVPPSEGRKVLCGGIFCCCN